MQKHKVHEQEEDLSNHESIRTLTTVKGRAQYFIALDVQLKKDGKTVPLRVQVDSGATCSTMTLADYRKLTDTMPPKSDARLKLYDGTVIMPVNTDILRCTKAGVTKVSCKILDKATTSPLSG